MRLSLPARLPAVAAVAALAVALGGCMANHMTYGTGVTPGQQTFNDITGLIALKGKGRPMVDYEPRGKIVAPPAGAALPAPGSEPDGAVAANWPKDPDEAARQRKLARQKAGTTLLKTDDDNPDVILANLPKSKVTPSDFHYDASEQAMKDRDNAQKADKIRADLKNAEAGLDANGNRVRRTLTEPPVDYREPDPNAPVEYKVAKKGFRWPWQKADPNATPDPAFSPTPQP